MAGVVQTTIEGDFDLFQLSRSYEENQKKLAARTVENYPAEWLTVYEALQNSQDAIQKGNRPTGQIDIELDAKGSRVAVWDNGKGFPHDVKLLGLGGTDKDQEVEGWRIGGSQGVGLKAVILSSKRLSLESVVGGKLWRCEIEDGYKYLEKAVKIRARPEGDSQQENYTKVEYVFPENRPMAYLIDVWERFVRYLEDDLAKTPLDKLKVAIQYAFRSYSYAACINRLLQLPGMKPIHIKVRISGLQALKDSDGPQDLKDAIGSYDSLEIEFPCKHWDIHEVVANLPKRKKRPEFIDTSGDIPDGGRIGEYTTEYVWVKDLKTKDEFASLLRNSYMKTPPDPKSYERLLFDRILGIHIVIGSVDKVRKYLVERPRQFIAAQGVPTSHTITSPGTGDPMYHPNIHFIINTKERLNYGKQTISNPRLIGTINSFYNYAYRATLKNIAKSIVGEQRPTSSAGDIIRATSESQRVLTLPDLPPGVVSIMKEPTDENAVIALFYELIGRNRLRGYRTYWLASKETYDGKITAAFVGQGEPPVPTHDKDLINIEFKLKLTSLIDDFEEGRKHPEEVSLAVVWEDDFKAHPGYQVIDIDDTEDRDRRLDGVRVALSVTKKNRIIQVLVLKEIIEELAKQIKGQNEPGTEN